MTAKKLHVLDRLAAAGQLHTEMLLTRNEVRQLLDMPEIRDALYEAWRERDRRSGLAALPGYRICYFPLNGPAPDHELLNRCEPSPNPLCCTCWCVKDWQGTKAP